jgi:RND superfamily putative drug exporter
VWILLLLAGAPLIPQAARRLQFGGFTSQRMESVRAQQLLEQHLGARPASLVVLFTSPTLTVDDPEFTREVNYSLAGLQGAPGVERVVSHLTNPRQVSRDRHTAYELVVLSADDETAARQVGEITSSLRQPLADGVSPQFPALTPPSSALGPQSSSLRMLVTGGPVFFSEVERLSHEDLQRAEIVAFPFAAVALLAVFGTPLAAGLPIALGGATVVGILAAIALISRTTDLSIFVMNVATMLGLGLGVDYSLFMTSRFREELRRGGVGEAVAATVGTAGRAVFFSGLSVFVGLAALSSFEFMLLRSLGLIGMVGIVLCVVAALTLLPALLGILGNRIDCWPVFGGRWSAGRFWERSAGWVMRHPVAVFVPTLLFLVALGTPFLHVRFSAPDANILPPYLESRQALDLLRSEFGESETAPMLVAVQMQGSVFRPDNISRLYDFTHSLARDPRVTGVQSIVDLDPRITKAQYQLIYEDPSRISDPYGHEVAKVLARGSVALVEVSSRDSPVSESSKQLVEDIRGMVLPEGMSILVGGTSANVIDVVNILYADAPRALAIVVVGIYAILFLLFRSVLLPAKAIVMNTLSILASYGALVFIFQDGHFQWLLNFRSEGTVEASTPIILFCILFGLSMDYEVFLLTRIKEEYDRTGDNAASVAKGLEKSGKIITSAAIIVVVVGAAFSMADIVIIKALGLGIALAVLLDATVVRTLLVPATMRLLGNLNWWAPAWLLRRLPEVSLEDSPTKVHADE